MYESLKSSLIAWNADTSERDKLQHFYVVLAVVLLLAAGVLGLFSYRLGQQVLAVAIASGLLFLVNAVAWALLQAFVLFRIDKTSESAHKNAVNPKKSPQIKK